MSSLVSSSWRLEVLLLYMGAVAFVLRRGGGGRARNSSMSNCRRFGPARTVNRPVNLLLRVPAQMG
jgi:hypothetical protein